MRTFGSRTGLVAGVRTNDAGGQSGYGQTEEPREGAGSGAVHAEDENASTCGLVHRARSPFSMPLRLEER